MKSSLDPTAFASRAMEAALKAGADETDAYVRSSSHLSIEVRNGEIESLRRAATFGLGLRVKVDGRTALVHTTNTGAIALLKLVDRAVKMARALPRPEEEIPFAPAGEAQYMPHPDPDLVGEPHEKKTARLLEIEKAMLAVKGVTASGGAGYEEDDGEIALVNSHGLQLYSVFCNLEMGVEAIAERGGESYTGGRHTRVPARRYLQDPETFGREAGERAASLLGARRVASTRAPVIFTPYTGWTVLACLARPLRGDLVVQGRSYLADHLGREIAAKGVSIRDNAFLSRGPGCRPFDGEGTPSRDLRVIKDGMLQSYFTDLSSAATLGVPPGGNAVRESYDARPEIQTSNFHMEAGNVTAEDILRETGRGLLLNLLSGWWVGLSGVVDTYSSAAMGYWIENGEIVHPVKGITIAGSLREMLLSIDRIGNDLTFKHMTCTPTFRVAEMAISGA